MWSSFNGTFSAGMQKSATVAPVLSGLKVWYDPGNSSSYSGSGSTLNDLSGNNLNATINGSPTYSSPYFTFDGVNDYIMTPDISVAKGSGNAHTVEVWIYPTAYDAIWTDQGAAALNTGYYTTGAETYSAGPFGLMAPMLWNTSDAVERVGVFSGSLLNNWCQLVRVYNGSGTATAYRNAVSATASSITWDAPANWYIGFGAQCNTFFAQGGYFTGRYGVVRVYNRALSGVEITQNYNASKSKYGL